MNIRILAALAAVVTFVGFSPALANTPAPDTSKAPAVTAPATPTVTEPTNVQIADCADKALKANGLDDRKARRIKVGAKHTVAGFEHTFAKGDMIWTVCKTALTDPLATKVAVAKTEVNRLNAQANGLEAEVKAATTALEAKKAEHVKVFAELETARAALASAETEFAAAKAAKDAAQASAAAASAATASAAAQSPPSA